MQRCALGMVRNMDKSGIASSEQCKYLWPAAVDGVVHGCPSTVVLVESWCAHFQKHVHDLRASEFARVVKRSLQQFVTSIEVCIFVNEEFNQTFKSKLCSYVQRRFLGTLLHRRKHFLGVMSSQVSQDFFDVSDLDEFEKFFVLIIISSSRGLFSEPVHVELAPLQLFNYFGLVIEIPVFFRILLEVHWKGRVHNSRC